MNDSSKPLDIIEEYIKNIISQSTLSREEILEQVRQKKEEKKDLTDIGALFMIKKELELEFSVFSNVAPTYNFHSKIEKKEVPIERHVDDVLSSSETVDDLFENEIIIKHWIIYEEFDRGRRIRLLCDYHFKKNRDIDVKCYFPYYRPIAYITYFEPEIDVIPGILDRYHTESYPSLEPSIDVETMIFFHEGKDKFTGDVVTNINYTSGYQKFGNFNDIINDKEKMILSLIEEVKPCTDKALEAAGVLPNVYGTIDDDYFLAYTNKWEYFQ